MENNNNNTVGFISGLVGGAIKYYHLTGTFIIDYTHIDYTYMHDLAKSTLTALMCGGAGILGKVIITGAYNFIAVKVFHKKIKKDRDDE